MATSSDRLRTRLSRLAAGLCIAALACTGCRRQPGAENQELILYCGAGIRPAVAEAIEAFQAGHDVRILADYAGSEVLLSKVRLTQKGDLYMPGERHYVQLAAETGIIAASQPVFYWKPVILVAKGNPKRIRDLKDLLQEGMRIGLGDPRACAIGSTSRSLLQKNGIEWSDIADNLKFQSQTVNELGLQIQAGALDAVIVWDSIARFYESHGDAITIDDHKNIVSSVDIGILTFSRSPAAAEAFVDFLLSPQGRAIFHKHHYSTVSRD